ELDVPPRARVHFENAQHAVARVALELGAEDAAIVELRQQLRETVDRAGDLVERDAVAIRAVAEIRRKDADAPPREQSGQDAVAIAEAVDEVVIGRRAGHV